MLWNSFNSTQKQFSHSSCRRRRGAPLTLPAVAWACPETLDQRHGAPGHAQQALKDVRAKVLLRP